MSSKLSDELCYVKVNQLLADVKAILDGEDVEYVLVISEGENFTHRIKVTVDSVGAFSEALCEICNDIKHEAIKRYLGAIFDEA